MLEGFIEETAPLNEFEQSLVEGFVTSFSKRIGKESAITNKDIQAAYAAKGIEVKETRVRKIINHIRTHDLVPGLIATSKGYYISTDPEEVLSWIKSLHGRETAIATIRSRVLNYLGKLIEGKATAL